MVQTRRTAAQKTVQLMQSETNKQSTA